MQPGVGVDDRKDGVGQPGSLGKFWRVRWGSNGESDGDGVGGVGW